MRSEYLDKKETGNLYYINTLSILCHKKKHTFRFHLKRFKDPYLTYNT